MICEPAGGLSAWHVSADAGPARRCTDSTSAGAWSGTLPIACRAKWLRAGTVSWRGRSMPAVVLLWRIERRQRRPAPRCGAAAEKRILDRLAAALRR